MPDAEQRRGYHLDSKDAAAALPEPEQAAAMAEKFLPADHPHLEEHRETLAKCTAALSEATRPAEKAGGE